MKKVGNVNIINNGCKLACLNQQDEFGNNQDSIVVWVSNKHELYESDEATGWILAPTILNDNDSQNIMHCPSQGKKNNMLFIEMCQENGSKRLRLVFDEETECLELVD